MSAFDELMAFERETQALGQIAGLLDWDQQAMMPAGAADLRGEERAAIEGVLHARRTDPRLADWLARAEAPDAAGAAQLRLVARSHARATKVPGRLAQEIARVTSVAQGIWAEARARDDVAAFLPTLAEVIRLKREEAACLAQDGSLYDALIDDFEPGLTAADAAAMFAALRPRLVALRAALLAAPPPPALSAVFPRDAQMAVARDLASAFGYDWNRGRLDLVVHPFASGSGDDVRITTRAVEKDPFNCLYSTVHEVGHATYEQNIAREFALTPIGQGVSMGVHESQSRIYENQLARSPAFCGWLHGRMLEAFGDFGVPDAQNFARVVNRVATGFIRTEADEVHYNLHIMLRFDLEQALIGGDLLPADLEAAWNDRFLADFGLAVDRPAHGMLQDVHWSCGVFGYFPTYALGNLYAGCLHAALRRDLPDLDQHLAKGDPRPATAWLREKLQRFGGLRTPRETIIHATGEEPSAGPLLDYLEAKYRGLFGV